MDTLLQELSESGHVAAGALRQAWAMDAFLTGHSSAAEAARGAGVSAAEFEGWLRRRNLAHRLDTTRADGSMDGNRRLELSVVLPIYNEEENIVELQRRLANVLGHGNDYELLFVNDGSSDGSGDLIRRMQRTNPQIKLLNLSRNFGHQAAITAGMNYSVGRAVIILDADLQDPPELIGEMIGKWRGGAKVVYAVRRKRMDGLLKRGAYYGFYRILKVLSNINIPLDSGDFCLLDRAVVDELKSLPEKNRFLRGLRSWVGFAQLALPYERQSRHAGQPKYRLRNLIKLALDGILSFSTIPLRLATYLGFFVCLCGLVYLAFAVVAHFVNNRVPVGWTSIVALILLIGGTQLLLFGVLGEYIARIYDESKQRPLYIVESFTDASEK